VQFTVPRLAPAFHRFRFVLLPSSEPHFASTRPKRLVHRKKKAGQSNPQGETDMLRDRVSFTTPRYASVYFSRSDTTPSASCVYLVHASDSSARTRVASPASSHRICHRQLSSSPALRRRAAVVVASSVLSTLASSLVPEGCVISTFTLPASRTVTISSRGAGGGRRGRAVTFERRPVRPEYGERQTQALQPAHRRVAGELAPATRGEARECYPCLVEIKCRLCLPCRRRRVREERRIQRNKILPQLRSPR
jgi:hypothetical protein